jgi:hypothetical protein
MAAGREAALSIPPLRGEAASNGPIPALPVWTLRKGHATLIRRPHIGREILSFVYLMRRTLGDLQ